MSAEAIAKVVADLKRGRIDVMPIPDVLDDLDALRKTYAELSLLNEDTMALAQWADVIDATPMFERWMESSNRMVYEDHRICPPWDNAMVCFVNTYANVTVMSVRAVDFTDARDRWDSLADTHVIDWDRVRWVLHVALYVGGRGGGHPISTKGPMHVWRLAVYPDGEIADINWIQVQDANIDVWDPAMMVLLDTFDLCNCVNVEIAEPERHRSTARRLQRTGVKVNEIHIRPVSKSYRGKGTPLSAVGSGPLSSVRGHTAHYGPKYGRGLLFGKYEGRFWVPQHVRGSEMFGVNEKEYTVEP